MLLQASNPDLVSLASCYADLPCDDDPPWTAQQEKDHEEARAGFECDTAERREQFAATIQGKADRTAVDARVLAEVSQGTYLREAVRAGSSNAPAARPNNSTAFGASLMKGSR